MAKKKKKQVKALAKKPRPPANYGPEKWIPTPEEIKMMGQWYGQGLTKEQCAYKLGVAPDTLFRRQNEIPEISEAFKKGKANVDAFVTGRFYEQVKANNLTAMIFHMKARMGMRENNDPNINITNNNVQVDKMQALVSLPEEDLKKLLKQIPKGDSDD